MWSRILAVVCGLVGPLAALATDQTEWSQLLQRLRQPPMESRLKARTVASRDALEALAAAGFGGAEIGINFQLPADEARSQLADLLAVARQAHIQLDLAPGGSQPYVGPGISEADSMQQLSAQVRVLQPHESFDGLVEQPAGLAGHAVLVAVTAARVDHRVDERLILDPVGALDLTATLGASHRLHWPAHTGQWALFSFWQRATGQVPGPNPFQSPAQWSAQLPAQSPGRYFTADIFSAAGIDATLNVLARDILPTDGSLLAGSALAHDSLEVQAEIFWTQDLPAQFRRRRGYSLLPWLPAIVAPKKYAFNPLDPRWGGPLPQAPYEFLGDAGTRVRYDFDQTLTDLYIERYLRAQSDWAHAHGMQTRAQVAYNYFSLDPLRSGRAVDIPENESFDSGWRVPFDSSIPLYGTDRWRHMMDAYRLTGSSKDLARRSRATLEFGDDFALYRKQPIDYARQLNESLAGGITMGLMTAFAGSDPAWPAPRGLAMIGLGDDWTGGWPQWRDWPALAGYFARSTLITEFGRASVDVAIYHDRGLSTVHDDAPLFASSSLQEAGFTYDFIDPAALARVGPAGSASLFEQTGYRALIVDHQAALPLATARALLALARRHVPIVLIGAPATSSPGWFDHAAQDRAVRATLGTLTSLHSVVAVATRDAAAAALLNLGCRPSASFAAAPSVLTVHRHSDTMQLWWLFNAGATSVSTVGSFQATGVPYQTDLWSGRTLPAPVWRREADRTQVPLTLAPGQSVALLFAPSAAPVHLTHAEGLRVWPTDDGSVATALGSSPGQLVFSDGRRRELDPATRVAPIAPADWQLQVDEFAPDGHHPHTLTLPTLADWRSLPGLRQAVGQALYTAHFDLTDNWFGKDRSAVLSVGAVAGAMRVSVNGQLVSEQSVGEGAWVIGALLQPGDNTIQIRLDTTLTNRMVALRESGAREYQTGPTALESAPSGVLGPVVLSSAERVSAAN